EGGPGTSCRHGGVLPERAGRLQGLVFVRVGPLPAGRFLLLSLAPGPPRDCCARLRVQMRRAWGVAPSPTSPGLQPAAGFAAVSPGVPPLLPWTLRRPLLTLSPFADRRTTGGRLQHQVRLAQRPLGGLLAAQSAVSAAGAGAELRRPKSSRARLFGRAHAKG